MKNLFSEPFLSLTASITIFLLSFSGSIFLFILSYPYSDASNLQYGHLLKDDNARRIASRNLVICSVLYAVLAVVMVYELILHFRQSRRQTWDPSIAMVNVHTPKPSDQKLTPNLSSSKVSGLNSPAAASGNTSAGRYRGGIVNLNDLK